MSVLFVVGRSKEASTAFRAAERMAEGGQEVVFLFTRNGCLHATDKNLVNSLTYAKGVNCLEADCRYEGLLSKVVDGVKLIDYLGWVELIEACDKIVSWL